VGPPDRRTQVLARSGVGLAVVCGGLVLVGLARLVADYRRTAEQLVQSSGLTGPRLPIPVDIPGVDLPDIQVPGYLTTSFAIDGALVAFWAVLILGLVAASTAWPRHGTRILAGAGTAALAAMLLPPWLIVDGIDGHETRRWLEVWPRLGPAASAGVAATAVLVVLVWYGVVSQAPAEPRILILTALCALVCLVGGAILDAHAIQSWLSARRDRGAYDDVVIVARLVPYWGFMVAQVLLVVAAARAQPWRALLGGSRRWPQISMRR
jgi:hypothetical protein